MATPETIVQKLRRLLDGPRTRGGVRFSYEDGEALWNMLQAGAAARAELHRRDPNWRPTFTTRPAWRSAHEALETVE